MIKGMNGQYTEKEIIEAMKMVKDICVRQEEECGMCPFYNEDYNDCNFNTYEPAGWDFKESEVWRVFA